MRIPRSVIQVIDTLFAWTKAQDWTAGQTPIVWPSNEKLAQKLGVSVRQVQNLLDSAVRAGLISHRDSANGHRLGKRDPSGRIIWAYGILLSPIGTRTAEFEAIAQQGAAADARIDALRKRLSSAARQVAALAQTSCEQAFGNTGAENDHAEAQQLLLKVRRTRDETILRETAEHVEGIAQKLEAAIAEYFNAEQLVTTTNKTSPADAEKFTPNTTTSQPQTAKAAYSRGYPEKSSGSYSVAQDKPQTDVETDLAEYGVDPAFISNVAPELCYQLEFGSKKWGDVIGVAETLVSQHGIHKQAWHEACRIMGQKGAAASVIATIAKYLAGEVLRPGAYLRGMSDKALRGELGLGRTFHGLKDRAKDSSMARMNGTIDVSSLVKRATDCLTSANRLVLSPTSSLM
jgi:replication initiation protein RepC